MMIRNWTDEQILEIRLMVAACLSGHREDVPCPEDILCPVDRAKLSITAAYPVSGRSETDVRVSCSKCQRVHNFLGLAPRGKPPG